MIDFDRVYDRRNSDSDKWLACAPDEIPMWVAEMDFPIADPILDAMKERLEHPFFGYSDTDRGAFDAITAHYQNVYGCEMKREWLMSATTVMAGVYAGCLTAGGRVMYCTPMYTHIRKVARDTGLPVTEVPLKKEDGRYSFDFEAMEAAVTPDLTTFILCNPHNPVGRVYTREELEQVFDFCRRHNLLIVADEIHCELIFEGKHIPLFSLCEEARVNTITVSGAAKICNLAMLPVAFAIIPDPELRKKFKDTTHGLFGHGATLHCIAMEKAYDGSCREWKKALISYLEANRDYMEERIRAINGLQVVHNEATYLAWIDCTDTGLEHPGRFFREKAKVYMNEGEEFGDEHFVRLNFGCPRSQLKEALDRIERALAAR